MLVVSIDIETTGIDIEYCQILEIGAVIFDTNSGLDQFDIAPKFKCIVDNGKRIQGEVYALNMNKRIIHILADLEAYRGKPEEARYRAEHNILRPNEVTDAFWRWLDAYGLTDRSLDSSRMTKVYLTFCGKNVATFDIPRLEKHIPNWSSVIKARQRYVDPTILFLKKDDDHLQNLNTCMERAGLKGEVTHDALQDAIDTAKVSIIGLNKIL